MPKSVFIGLCAGIAVGFAVFFAIYVAPPALQTGDIIGAFAAGFVNPFAAGYSTDTILCGVLLLIWVLYERTQIVVPLWWVVPPLTLVPGVATGFGLYLVLRLFAQPRAAAR